MIHIAWEIPTEKEDGSTLELSEIDGYYLGWKYGDLEYAEDRRLPIDDASQTSIEVDPTELGIPPGEAWFAMQTRTASGVSGRSNETVKIVESAKPNPPVIMEGDSLVYATDYHLFEDQVISDSNKDYNHAVPNGQVVSFSRSVYGGPEVHPCIVGSAWRSSSKSARSYLGPGPTESYRSEVTTSGPYRGAEFKDGDTQWIGGMLYLPETWPLGASPKPSAACHIWQCHHSGSEPGSSPVYGMSIRTGDDMLIWRREIEADPGGSVDLLSIKDLLGKWTKIQAEVMLSREKTGRYRAWVNGVLVLSQENVITFEPGSKKFGYYKLGMYYPGHTTGEAPERELFWSDFRVSSSVYGGSLAAVDPDNY